MARTMKIRTKAADGSTEIQALVNHPMETGQRTDAKTKAKIAAHFIQKMTFQLNGKDVAVVDTGIAVSKDPLISVRIKGAKAGDKVKVTWTDNQGESGSADTTVA